MNITQILSQELSATAAQITAYSSFWTTALTVPFIARYRKEATGGLDDTQLRQLCRAAAIPGVGRAQSQLF